MSREMTQCRCDLSPQSNEERSSLLMDVRSRIRNAVSQRQFTVRFSLQLIALA